MRTVVLSLLLFSSAMLYSQKGVTFFVETLQAPGHALIGTDYNDAFKRMIRKDLNISDYELRTGNKEIAYNIIAQSKSKGELVNYDYHSFFQGMYQAYSDHRPFVLSPDMIWLLISQGFAQHVNINSEKLRHYFVSYNGKTTLIVRNDSINLNDPNSPWEKVFPEFTNQIDAAIGSDLSKTLTADFSTTNITSRMASQITMMEAMKSYFEYVELSFRCGIPRITLEGKSEDWRRLYTKANQLRKYELGWWIDELEPLLQEFIKASEGNVPQAFWQSMFKYHTPKRCGDPTIIDGWIVKFFPYDKEGKRNNLKELKGTDNLPKEIVKVDLKYQGVDGGKVVEEVPLELWAGFIGLRQDKDDFTLKPEIGWMIRKKEANDNYLKDKLSQDAKKDWGGINIRGKKVPEEILGLDSIKSLTISFVDKIEIPDAMGKIKITELRLYGNASEQEIERICKLFPDTRLYINDKGFNNTK
ncbi:DUF4419 domain-containing protein [Parabacteroides sp. FAFU027]|uniref:DUF4419 domain-containing protein n=1 Tax=Parabacteroides sp. FAFU027 TaxID=2922715 RepID=UPI001FAFFFBD|nr:DUF4419 domain-containing protein [Parabacteroides sp. FAFU027]